MAATLPPIRPAASTRTRYQKRLDAAIDDMVHSVIYWTRAAYRSDEPATVELAQDGVLNDAFDKLARRWLDKFDDLAPKLAEWFAQDHKNRVDRTLKKQLRDAGFTVKFKMTAPMRDAFAAVVDENVALIKSIADKYLTDVKIDLMQSVQNGRDLGYLTDRLVKRTGITHRRAAFISRDQNNRATAVMARTRQLELGITQAKWLHSAGGKTPRPKHVAFSGQVFDLATGHDFEDGEGHVLPGQPINCFPGNTSVDLVNGCHEIWRYHYRGDLIALETGKPAVFSTPNHPFLADSGWVPAHSINQGDYVWQARFEEIEASVGYVEKTQPTIEQVFLALSEAVRVRRRAPGVFNFHGDVPDAEVESVRPDPILFDKIYSGLLKGHPHLQLSEADIRPVEAIAMVGEVSHSGVSGGPGEISQVLGAGTGEAEPVGLGTRTLDEARASQSFANQGSGDFEMRSDCQRTPSLVEQFGDGFGRNLFEVSNRVDAPSEHDPVNDLVRDPEMLRNGGERHPSTIHFDNLVEREILATEGITETPIGGFETPSAEVLAKLVRVYAQMGCQFFKAGKFRFERVRVIKKLVRKNSSAHVYTLQTDTGWFSAGPSSLATKNCRCVSVPVLPEIIR